MTSLTQADAKQVPADDDRVEWLESVYGIKFTPEQRRCVVVLCALGAPHNLSFRKTDPIDYKFASALIVHVRTHILATIDMDCLTELTIRAHKYSVRVDIEATSRYMFRIALHARPPGNESRISQHPTLEALAQRAIREDGKP